MKRCGSILTAVMVMLVLSTSQAAAQFYKVYGYQAPGAGELELVSFNTYIPASDLSYSYFGKELDKEGLLAHALELEYGITTKYTAALYFDFADPADGPMRYIRTRALACYYRFYDPGVLPMDLGFYAEYIIPKKDYDDSEQLELKLIMEKSFGSLTLDLNPGVEKKTSGRKVDEPTELTFAARLFYCENPRFQPGLELYSNMGAISEFEGFNEQKHYIFPTLDISFGRKTFSVYRFIWHLGVGVGLTDASDKVVVKSIFSAGFNLLP
ncbi:hypothetical protein ACFLT7_04410 [candidate division KSB1 bacterium]